MMIQEKTHPECIEIPDVETAEAEDVQILDIPDVNTVEPLDVEIVDIPDVDSAEVPDVEMLDVKGAEAPDVEIIALGSDPVHLTKDSTKISSEEWCKIGTEDWQNKITVSS